MEVALKKRQARDAANKKYDSLVKASIKGTKRENMQSQELLRMEMQMAYKHGALHSGGVFFFFFSQSGAGVGRRGVYACHACMVRLVACFFIARKIQPFLFCSSTRV